MRARPDHGLRELTLEEAVHALDLLLLAELHPVVGEPRPALSVLPGRVGARSMPHFGTEAAVPLEEELRALCGRGGIPRRRVAPWAMKAPQTRRRLGGRQPLWGIGVTSRIIVTLMPAAWQCPDRRLAARRRAPSRTRRHLPHAVLHRLLGALLGGHLGGEGRRLARPLEALPSRTSPSTGRCRPGR